MPDVSLESYARAAPKAELHVHLEGAIRPRTLRELAARNGVEVPPTVEAGARAVYSGFDHFVELFVASCRCARTVEEHERLLFELAEDLAAQNGRYAEVTFSPSTHYGFGVGQDVYLEGLRRGRERAGRELGVDVNFVFDVVRRLRDASQLHPMAAYTTGVAIEARDVGVVALGLGGSEANAPPEQSAPYFDRARAAGLKSHPHAGEHAGPPSIWGALRALGADRVAHGVRAIEDPALVAHLAANGVALDLTPSSNCILGVCPTMADHPLPRLRAAGVPVTVGSDDPTLFGVTLADEAALLADPFAFDADAIDDVLLNALRYSFLPPERREALVAAFQAELDALKPVHLT